MKRLKNQSGSILLLVLVVAPIAAILFFSLIDMALLSRTQSLINRNVVSYSAVLDSAIDYTQYAVKNHWCMNTTWERDTSAVCDLAHPMNLERLMVDPQTVRSYTRLNPGASGVLIKRIDGLINIATIPSTSPLYQVVRNMDVTGGSKLVGQIEISVQRIDSADFPRRGRESYLLITASLVSANPTISFFRNFTKLSARSRVMVTPRELNYFSFIVPHDLRLDGSAAGPGDVSIPATAGRGIAFESPVYVNGDIHVPSPTTSVYIPATFTSKIVLGANTASGGGRIMSGGTPLSQPSGGYKDMLYTSMNGFGGLKKGFDVDDTRDKGLDVFAGLIAPAAVPLGAQEKCVDYNEVKSSLDRTKFSDLVAKQTNYTPSGGSDTVDDVYEFNLGLTDGNIFLPQDVKPYIRGPRMGSTITDTATGSMSPAGRTEMRVIVTIGTGVSTPLVPNGRSVEFVIRKGIKAVMPLKDFSGAGLHPKLLIEVDPFEMTPGGDPQPHLRKLKVTAQGKKGQIGPIEIKIIAFDVGNWSGRDRRVDEIVPTNPDFTLGKGHSMEGSFFFSTATNAMVLTTKNPLAPPITAAGYVKLNEAKRILNSGDDQLRGQHRPQPAAPAGPDELFDYAQVITDCHSPHLQTSNSSFASASFNSDFSPETRHSWHFAPAATVIDTTVRSWFSLSFQSASAFVIPDTEPPTGPGPVDTRSPFLVKSIVGKCSIPATTTFVAGFLVCDELNIGPRTQPLMMIGTFITQRAVFDPSAVAAGITFRSIYHPQATADLRAHKVLRDNFGGDCPTVTDPNAPPIWWPELDPVDYTKLRSCSVVSLRDQANPFTWTKMDPDCGLDTVTNTFMACKNHPENYLLAEISRESDLQ